MKSKRNWHCAACKEEFLIPVDADDPVVCQDCLGVDSWPHEWLPEPVLQSGPASHDRSTPVTKDDTSRDELTTFDGEWRESANPGRRKRLSVGWLGIGLALILVAIAAAEWREIRELLFDDERPNLFVRTPVVQLNPEENAPLVALVQFVTSRPVMTTIEIDDRVSAWDFVADETPQTDHHIAICGLKPNREHRIRVRIETPDREQSQASKPIVVRTPALPADFPPIQVHLSRPERMEPGLTLFAANRWENGERIHDYGYVIAVDATGDVVWYYRSALRISDLRLLSNNRLLCNGAKFFGLYEVDLLGRTRRKWWASQLVATPHEEFISVPVDSFHHEILELPNGNFLALSTELRNVSGFPKSETEPLDQTEEAAVVGDVIVEFQPDGTVVDRIHLHELLDSRRIGYGSLSNFWATHYKAVGGKPSRDWSHANSLIYDADTNEIIVSLRHQDCIVKIDRQSRELVWIFGDPMQWRSPWKDELLNAKGELQWPYHQHGVHLTPQGTLLMYDNGNYRTLPPGVKLPASENASRVVEFRIDEEMRTVEQLWEYGPRNEQFYSPFYCEADVLPATGNVLVTDGGRIETHERIPSDKIPADYQWARIFEVTRSEPAEKVFEITVDSGLDSSIGWSIYRSERIPDRQALSKIATAELKLK